jgi:oxalate decarboxylase/phosphoglucose isomerase-like protein (cupin superfamily)
MINSTPFFVLTIAAVLTACSVMADPNPVRDFVNPKFKAYDFVFKNLTSLKKAQAITRGGSQHMANARTFPAIQTLGTSATLLRINPCGINSPHTHPRGTEHQYLFQGTLAIGLVDTHGNYYANIVKAGDTFVFPKSLLHFEQNVGTEEVISLAFFNSELAGTIAADEAYYKVPATVLGSSFGITNTTLVRQVFRAGSKVVGFDKNCYAALKKGKAALAKYAQGILSGRKV